MPVDTTRIQRRIEELAAIIDPSLPNYTRESFTETYLHGRAWLREALESVGLTVHLDAAANLIATRPGLSAELPTIAIGSHTDTVVGGGRFDGIAGVVVAMEVAEVLHEEHQALRHPLRVIDFLAEEPSVYGVSCVGSRALVGALTSEHLGMTAPSGETLASGMRRMGAQVEALTGPLAGADEIAAFLELHIEQGRRLERAGEVIGVVSGVVGIWRYQLTIRGQANHAGTTAMEDRQDALRAAAEIICDTYDRARSDASSLVATIGQISVAPNSANVVPGSAILTLEVRSLEASAIETFVRETLSAAKLCVERLGCALEASPLTQQAPVLFDERVQRALVAAAEGAGQRSRSLVSGAGHDAAQLAPRWRAGMIFVPSKDGVSHHEREWTDATHLAAGAETLLRTVLSLDAELDT